MRIVIMILFVCLAVNANAALSLDDSKGDTTFRVASLQVSPDEAVRAAVEGKQVQRCKPKSLNDKKTYYTSSGTATEVLECTSVELKVNPKSGAVSWKVLK